MASLSLFTLIHNYNYKFLSNFIFIQILISRVYEFVSLKH